MQRTIGETPAFRAGVEQVSRRLIRGTALVVALVARLALAQCVSGSQQNCQLANGCGGVQTCSNGANGVGTWGACTCAGGLQPGASCTITAKCGGGTGAKLCNATCTTQIGCSSGTCSVCGGTNNGQSYCVSGLTYCKGPETCNACDDNGDGIIDNAPGSSAAYSLTSPCNPNSCPTYGTRTCSSAGWSSCTGCTGTSTCSVCSRASTKSCATNCTVSACAPLAEVCNRCDDNGNGVMDDGLHCPKCNP